jgi:hypothetical protein
MKSMYGKAGAALFYKMAYHEFGVRGGYFKTENVFGTGDFRTEEGSYFLLNGEHTLIDEGKYLVLWQKTTDGWKMFRDCFNSNHTPQQKQINDEKYTQAESPDGNRVYRYPTH